MSILNRLSCLNLPLPPAGFVEVMVGPARVGWTKPDFAQTLADAGNTWSFTDNRLRLDSALQGFEERSAAISRTFHALSDAGIIPPIPDYSALGGVDLFGVYENLKEEPLACVERFFAPYLGLINQAVILNGFCGADYWIATRGKILHDAPGMMDILTAGAVDYRHPLHDVLLEEAHTEAGLNSGQMQDAKTIGPLYLQYLSPEGFLRREQFTIYDLELPKGFTPVTNLPLEVEGFELVSMARALEMLEAGNIFKEAVNLVVAHFLLRHGYMNAHPEAAALTQMIKAMTCPPN